MQSFSYMRAGVVVICVVVALFVLNFQRITFALFPSAERAYSYGIGHINVPGRAYDLARAESYFKTALRLEPNYPMAHHQLARIHFLNGDYEQALAEVNVEIQQQAQAEQSAPYYLRGLIEGYLGMSEESARDYGIYVSMHPEGWEGRTDYAWALVKVRRFDEALLNIDSGLVLHPENPWLLSVRATTLYELGRLREAAEAARLASLGVDALSEQDWHNAYPGNAPRAAKVGLETLRNAIYENRQKIDAALEARPH